jgi:hypothetical protein
MSEREGRTPCYYTRDLKVYRKGNVEEPICDWNVDGYRLPTEAEWDCAARGGNTTRYHWGSKLADQDAYRAWNWKGGDKKGFLGMKKPNDFGMHDVAAGNYEWTWDWDGHWNPEDTNHPKGPSLEEVVLTYQWMFMMNGLEIPPVFLISRRCRGNDVWGINVLQAKWGTGWPATAEYSKAATKGSMGGVYRYPNARSWQDLGHNHGQPPTGGFGGILRPVISANLSEKEHIALKPLFDLKKTLSAPRLAASSPRAPEPENRSTTVLPFHPSEEAILSKRARLERTVVGRTLFPFGASIFIPEAVPPVIFTDISQKVKVV